MGHGCGELKVWSGRAQGLVVATVQMQREARELDEGR